AAVEQPATAGKRRQHRGALDALVSISIFRDAVLSHRDRPRPLVCAFLRLAAAGLSVGPAGTIPMGLFAAIRDLGSGEAGLQHLAFPQPAGEPPDGPRGAGGGHPGNVMEIMASLGPLQFFAEPGLWIGLAIAAALLFVAVRLRRLHGPI